MASHIQQNRVVIQLARECLEKANFEQIELNREQGIFPDVRIIAARSGTRFLIGITGREEIGADGEYNPSYTIASAASGMETAKNIARRHQAVLAFVTIPLQKKKGKFCSFFGTLQAVKFRRSIPMLLPDRRCYEMLQDWTHDDRVAALA